MTSPPRIGMIVCSSYPEDPRVRREAEALAAAGMAVDIICVGAPGRSAVERFGAVTAYRVLHDRPRESMTIYLLHTLLFSAVAFLKLIRLSISVRYDLIQAHNMPDFLIFVGWLHKLLGRPLVLDLHDLSVELLASKWSRRKSAWLRPLAVAQERLSCAFANRLITTSEGFRRRLIERGIAPDKITLVLNTPESALFPSMNGAACRVIPEGVRLLYHGTVAGRFGLLTAVECLPHLQRRIPGSRLEIYGKYDPSYRQLLERRIAELGLTESVKLGGWLHREEIVPVIRQADIGVVPYQADEFMNLAHSTKTFEYATSGLPIVASRLDSIRSVFAEEDLYFFNPGDPEDMADRIVEVCLDPELRKAKVARSRESIAKVSGDVMTDRYRRLILETVNRSC